MPNLLWLTDLFVKKLILIHFISIPSSYAFFLFVSYAAVWLYSRLVQLDFGWRPWRTFWRGSWHGITRAPRRAETPQRREQLWQAIHVRKVGPDAHRQALHDELGSERILGLLFPQPRIRPTRLKSSPATWFCPRTRNIQRKQKQTK